MKKRNVLNLIIVAIIIIMAIITFGGSVKREKSKIEDNQDNKLDKAKENEISEREQIEKDKKRYDELKEIKSKLERKRKIVFLIARIIIASILVFADLLYLFCKFTSWDIELILNSFLILNSSILMVYSFIAFIIYGTINKFTVVMKEKFAIIMMKRKYGSIDSITSKIEILEKRLTDKEDFAN